MRIGSLITLLCPVCAWAGLAVDGQLDEAEWQTAERFGSFLTAEPLSLEPPGLHTEIRILARPEGLYMGVTAQGPRALRTYGQSPRDATSLDADSVRVVVDFEGRGQSAYEFTVSLSNSRRDGLFLSQTSVSYDWDGAWRHAVSEDDENWYLELLLPWSLAPTPASTGPSRSIGFWCLRTVKALNRGYAFPAMETERPSFIADLHRLEVPVYQVRTFNLFPYVAVSHDMLEDNSEGRVGLDLFWKPDAQTQLALTLNPDFAQVESDDLVVNFTAIETFFSEKRPFFTEGQSVFDQRTTNGGRLINTRRIGAAPDAGVEGSSDILGAAKFTGLAGRTEYGAFAALEDDSSAAQGRRFAAARLRYKFDSAALGYLGTFTHRPTLDRQAQVHMLDANWTARAGASLTTQLIGTHVDEPGGATDGFGATAVASYSPGGRLQQDLNLTWFDRHFDINDLGYLPRGSLRELQTITHLHTRQFPAESRLNATFWRINSRLRYNDFGERLPLTLELGRFWRFREPMGIFVYYLGHSSGIDDLITRGNGHVRLPPRHEVGAQYQLDVTRRFNFLTQGFVFQEGLEDIAWRFSLHPTYILAENLNLSLDLDYTDSADWLIWRAEAARLATHERQQLSTQVKLSWYPAPRQELRVKAQWVGLRARVLQGYTADAAGHLLPDAARIDDLSLGTFGLQVRYRYELKPLSDLYLVYSRGGFDFRAEYAGNLTTLFDAALENRTASLLLLKLRYRF